MKNLWSEVESAKFNGDIEKRVFTSRLLGADKSLVLHGGGNTSVKVQEENLFGETEEILYVKGSGWDLETIQAGGFSPVYLEHLKRLAALPLLPDPAMVNEMVTHMTRATAPVPSVEAILHAILPYKFVDHTHADAVITVTNSVGGESRIREIYGDSVVVIPYVMPGFDLARLCAQEFARQAGPRTVGMVLLNHGIFSFGATAKESYERMIALVGMAEAYLALHQAWNIPLAAPAAATALTNAAAKTEMALALAGLRKDISGAAGFSVVMARYATPQTLTFSNRTDLLTIAAQGPATPDHVIRTKRLPMLGRNVQAYAQAYREEFAAHEPLAKERKTMLDPAPRVVLDPEFGLCAVGRTIKDASIVGEIYMHTMDIISRATALGGYQALPAKDIFDVEYWDLEQAKLSKGAKPAAFSGEVALVTGAASGIGRACVDSLLARGAAVVGIDINPNVKSLYARADFLGLECDVTAEAQLVDALYQTVQSFGGIDMLVLNAGMFPAGCRIDALATDTWRKVMQVNLDANFVLMRETHPYLALAPRGGRVVIIGSKNVPAPGPGAAAYSASKAALNQLARVAALEWGSDKIRINSLHPNAVFDTGLWTDEVLASRAKHYGMTVEAYKKNNVLKTEILSRDVAELAAEMCGTLFFKTTGAQVPIDGGNDRVI